MPVIKDNTRTILLMGFTTIILLLLLVAGYSLYRVDRLTQNLTTIVEVNNRKIELAEIMQQAINHRWIHLSKIVSSQDAFEQDEEAQKLYKQGLAYSLAREEIMLLPMSDEEIKLHTKLEILADTAAPLLHELVNKILSYFGSLNIDGDVRAVKHRQGMVIEHLNQLVSLVKEEAMQASQEAHKEHQRTYTIMFFLVGSIIVIAITIARAVSNYVTTKNRDLANAMEVKSRFLANMSHEIRTPLTAIIGFAEYLLQPELSKSEQTTAANTIIRNGSHLQHIVDEILDLSKDEANKLEACRVDVWLLDLISEVEEAFVHQASKKGLQFELHYHPPIAKRITSDPIKLKQILYNLCNNAVKFTDSGTIKLNIGCNISAQQLHIDVVDNGIGIHESLINKIFDPFVQADTSSSRKFGGTGLGLHLSKRFAEMLGGSLTVSSTYGKGSCFTLSLPTGPISKHEILTTITPHTKTPVAIHETVTTPRLSGRVLLAEDTRDNQLLIEVFLKDTAIRLTVVENGKQAVDTLAQGSFDLVLMDIQMPIMTGLEATQRIRDMGWTGTILALTANVLPEDCQQYLQNGFNDIIGKPVSRAQLLDKLANYLHHDGINDTKFIYSTLENEGPDFLPVIEYFVHQSQSECQTLEVLLENQNWPDLLQQLHRLKGSGGGVGFQIVTDIAKSAETCIKEKRLSEARVQIDNLVTVLNNVRLSECYTKASANN